MYKDRKEQREITETMNSLLLQLLPYLNSDMASKVRRALQLLGEIEIRREEEKDKTCPTNSKFEIFCYFKFENTFGGSFVEPIPFFKNQKIFFLKYTPHPFFGTLCSY